MIWGMTTSTFTELHVALSLVGMATGLIVMIGLLRGRGLEGWTAIFLLSLAATSVTGFAFPVEHLLPSHKVGAVSLLVLAAAALARYGYRLRGAWRSRPSRRCRLSTRSLRTRRSRHSSPRSSWSSPSSSC